MSTKESRRNRYTVLLIPDSNERTFSVRLYGWFLRGLFLIMLIFVVGISVLVYHSGTIALKLQLVQYLREENHRLREENRFLKNVTDRIETIEQTAEYLRRLARFSDTTALGTSEKQIVTTSPPGSLYEDTADLYTENQREMAWHDAMPKPGSVPNIFPVEGWLTRTFDVTEQHSGVDFAATKGTPIRATAPGVVDSISNTTYFGLVVSVRHDGGYLTRYGHCSQILVRNGDLVERGQTIALVGNTGRSSAPHLHYEVYFKGLPVDPMTLIIDRQSK